MLSTAYAYLPPTYICRVLTLRLFANPYNVLLLGLSDVTVRYLSDELLSVVPAGPVVRTAAMEAAAAAAAGCSFSQHDQVSSLVATGPRHEAAQRW